MDERGMHENRLRLTDRTQARGVRRRVPYLGRRFLEICAQNEVVSGTYHFLLVASLNPSFFLERDGD